MLLIGPLKTNTDKWFDQSLFTLSGIRWKLKPVKEDDVDILLWPETAKIKLLNVHHSTTDIQWNILIIVSAVASLCAALGEWERRDLWDGSEVGVEPGCWPLMMTFDFSIPSRGYGHKTAFSFLKGGNQKTKLPPPPDCLYFVLYLFYAILHVNLLVC